MPARDIFRGWGGEVPTWDEYSRAHCSAMRYGYGQCDQALNTTAGHTSAVVHQMITKTLLIPHRAKASTWRIDP